MRRNFLWYGIAAIWAIAALAGFLLHHQTQAIPALIVAAAFAAVGYSVGRRDHALRARAPRLRNRD